MRATDPVRNISVPRQSGVVALSIVFLLLLLIGGVLTAVFSISGSVAHDAGAATQRTQALYLAESGLERATRRYIAGGVACGNLGETVAMGTVGTFTVSAGVNTHFNGTTVLTNSCRVNVTGTLANNAGVRVVEAILTQPNNVTATPGNTSFQCSVPPAEDLLVFVGLSWTTGPAVTVTITGVSLAGQTLSQVAGPTYQDNIAVESNVNQQLRVGTQQFFLTNPPTGTLNGTVTMSASPLGLVVGCIALAGVDQVTPIDSFASAGAVSNAPAVSVTTSAAGGNSFVIDTVGRDNSGNLSVSGGRTVTHNFSANNRAGAGSYTGPIAANTTVNMNWTWNQSRTWVMSAAAIRASSANAGGAGRVRLPGGGVQAWREVIAMP